jgi:hypothetical protein
VDLLKLGSNVAEESHDSEHLLAIDDRSAFTFEGSPDGLVPTRWPFQTRLATKIMSSPRR